MSDSVKEIGHLLYFIMAFAQNVAATSSSASDIILTEA